MCLACLLFNSPTSCAATGGCSTAVVENIKTAVIFAGPIVGSTAAYIKTKRSTKKKNGK